MKTAMQIQSTAIRRALFVSLLYVLVETIFTSFAYFTERLQPLLAIASFPSYCEFSYQIYSPVPKNIHCTLFIHSIMHTIQRQQFCQ
jgi:hypothetical protein